MAPPRLVASALIALVLCACGAETNDARGIDPRAEDGENPLPDADADGLCDFTEDEFGTDPEAADSDGDGLPDVIELVNGLDPTDANTPAPGQTAHLPVGRDASTDFELRVTVEGDGQGLSGFFDALPSAYSDGVNALDFFAGAVALSASPEGSVRSIDGDSARFGAVYGRTRLAFSLRFTYPWEALGGPLDCGRAYPFQYAIKADDGETRSERLYVLIVAEENADGTQAELCVPHDCQ